MEGIWRLREVLDYTRLSESTLRRRIRDGSFPASVPLGGRRSRAVGWRAAEVRDWLAGLDPRGLTHANGERP